MAAKPKIKPSFTKTKTAPRTRARVDSSEPKSTTAKKSADHRKTMPVVKAMAHDLGDSEVLISVQQSELVPVAQYANVTVGPNQLAWKLTGVDMSVLIDVDWETDDPLTKEQQAVFDRVSGALEATSKLIEDRIAADRAAVDASVAAHNAREAAKESGKLTGSRKKK